MKCKCCGKQLAQDNRFCPVCGAPNWNAEDTTAPPPPNPSRKKGDALTGGLIITCCLLLLVLGIVLWSTVFVSARTEREIDAVREMVETEIAPFTNEEGVVPEEKAEEAAEVVYARAKRNVARGEYAYAEKGENCVVIGLKSGGNYVYLSPEPMGEPAGSMGTPVVQPSTAQGAGGRIVTIQPYCKEAQDSHPRTWNYPDLAAQGIVDALEGYTFSDTDSYADDNRDDGEVTLEFLKRLSDYSVVIWQGHGGYTERIGNFLSTPIPYEKEYQNDLKNGYILICGDHICVTAAFFEKYLQRNDHPETVVYLATCMSGRVDALADAFLGKGFDCVIANSETITRTYNLNMEYTFIAGMSGENGEFLTSGEALDYAKSRHGQKDPYYYMHAYPILFGSPDVCFANAAPKATLKPTATPEPTATVPPAAAPDVRIDEERVTTLAVVCAILPSFDSSEELSKSERLSILHSGLWVDGFAMFGNKFQEAAYMGEDVALSAREASDYVQQTLGVNIPSPNDDFFDDDNGVYCYGDEYEVFGSDYNVSAVLCWVKQLGNGRAELAFDVFPQVDGVGDPNTANPNLVMTVEQSDGYWGCTVVAQEQNYW